ncbi:glycoside hydrolase, family 32 [Artemisia annua]|uniref:Glycoside hydrolase, family 32 n=1 Tax=Artemisia annua TaxID=35608 RepID=A0A2U1KT54_ARTAN|nr:glycoside hydrolase, family 32 [Artemisia annua]
MGLVKKVLDLGYLLTEIRCRHSATDVCPGYEQDALKATIEVSTRYGCTKTLGTVQRGSLRPFSIGVVADRTLTTFAPAYLRDAKNIYGSLPINFCIVKAKISIWCFAIQNCLYNLETQIETQCKKRSYVHITC